MISPELDTGRSDAEVDISIVVPAFNETENLAALSDGLVLSLEPLGRTWEPVLADDGSADQTCRRSPGCAPASACKEPAALPQLQAPIGPVGGALPYARSRGWTRTSSTRPPSCSSSSRSGSAARRSCTSHGPTRNGCPGGSGRPRAPTTGSPRRCPVFRSKPVWRISACSIARC
jgi:hypothetical protein